MSASPGDWDSEVAEGIARIRAWGEARDWCGHDPYDALTSPFATVLTAGRPLGRRLLTQAVKQSPVNLRPALRIPRAHEPKAIGLVLSAYAHLAATGDAAAARAADSWAAWLLEHSTADDVTGRAWGYHFAVQTRVFFYAADTPNTIATTFVSHALLDHAEICGSERSAAAARDGAAFLARAMAAEKSGRSYFRYVPGEAELVHNANALACSVLARTGSLMGEPDLVARAMSALQVTLDAQRDDGSWPYADSQHSWVDNFHTAYILESLAICDRAGLSVRDALERGLAYWERELFLDDLTPKYFPQRIYPIDAHCYAQAIDTWVAVAYFRSDSLAKASAVAALLVERMLDPSGYVYFQKWRGWTNRVPLIRWSTAPAFRALARYSARILTG